MLKKEQIKTMLKHIVVRKIQGKEVRIVDLETSLKMFRKTASHNTDTQLTWYHSLEATILHYTSEELWCVWETPCFQEHELYSLL